MYVCICQGITDRQIRRAVDQGARTLAEVQTNLPVGACCGRCVPTARDLIREQAAGQSSGADAAYGAANTAYA